MNDVTIRKRTGTLQRGTAGMKRSTPEDDEKSLPNKVDSEKSGEELEEWKLRPLSEAPKNDSHWAKNVEEGLSDIIKRLDQITVHRNHLPAIIPNLSAGWNHPAGSYFIKFVHCLHHLWLDSAASTSARYGEVT